MNTRLHAHCIRMAPLLLSALAASAAPAPTPQATNPTSKPAIATIESITQLSRQELAETLNTKILVTRAAGLKAQRESMGLTAPVLGAFGLNQGTATPIAPRTQKSQKEELLSLPFVVSITGVGQKLTASLSNGRSVGAGDTFLLGNASVTVESVSKASVVFKRCVKTDCTTSTGKVAGY